MKYLKSIYETIESPSQSTLSQYIKWDMIEDVKDIALDALDEGYSLIVEVLYTTINTKTNKSKSHYIYRLIYDHKKTKESWTKQDWYVNKKMSTANLQYKFRIINFASTCSYNIAPVKTFKLLARIRSAYPGQRKKILTHDFEDFHILQPLK